jgi:hypothetical protein
MLVGEVQEAVALDPDVERPVDHDFADVFVREESLERPVADDVVEDVSFETLTIGARETRLLPESLLDLLDDAGPHIREVATGLEELGPDLADDREVEAVLQICVGIGTALFVAVHLDTEALV